MDFREGDAQAPAFPDVSVHVVVSSSVIFFLPDPLEALRNWRRVLKPGGRLIVVQPNFRLEPRRYFDDYTLTLAGR